MTHPCVVCGMPTNLQTQGLSTECTQVVEPKIKAYLYTWGAGRTTAEGEHIPVRIEELDIGYIDAMLILPLIIEHTIDERSPLCGHTHDSLMSVRNLYQRATMYP